MKWFKHFSDASDDEFLTLLEARHGLDGYGRWFKLLEQIAKHMNKGNRCHAEQPWAYWLDRLRGKGKTVGAFLATCIAEGKLEAWRKDDETGEFLKLKPEHFKNIPETFLKRSENVLKMKCAKLLNLRDNHSRNLQATDKQEVEVEVEVEVEGDDEAAGIGQEKGPEKERMNLTEVGELYRQTFNVLQLPPLILPDLRDMAELFEREQITEAFKKTARAGGKSLAYTMTILQGGENSRGGSERRKIPGDDLDSFLEKGDHDEQTAGPGMAQAVDSFDDADIISLAPEKSANG